MQTKQRFGKGVTLISVFLVLLSLNAAAFDDSGLSTANDPAPTTSPNIVDVWGTDSTADNSDDSSDDSTSDSDSNDNTEHAKEHTDSNVVDTWGTTTNSDNEDSSDDSSDTNDNTGTVDNGFNDGSSDSGTDSSTEPSGSLEERTEQVLHQLLNEERKQRGLQPFNYDSELGQTADAKSQDMAENNYFSHNAPNGDNFLDIYRDYGYNCRIPVGGTTYLGGENIARTWFDTNVRADTGNIVHYDTAEELANGLRRQWMTSDGHRKAILRSYYDNHGLGVEITDDNRVYATEHFC